MEQPIPCAMPKSLHIHDPATTLFWRYWEHCYPQLGEADWKWFTQHVTVLRRIRRGQQLFVAGKQPDCLYFVYKGLLAAASWDEDAQRRIFEFAPPGYNLLTTELNASHPFEPQIVALRSSAAIILPAATLYDYGLQEKIGDALTKALAEKRAAQQRLHTALLLLADEKERYRTFAHLFPELLHITSQSEQADFLNISRASITRARRMG